MWCMWLSGAGGCFLKQYNIQPVTFDLPHHKHFSVLSSLFWHIICFLIHIHFHPVDVLCLIYNCRLCCDCRMFPVIITQWVMRFGCLLETCFVWAWAGVGSWAASAGIPWGFPLILHYTPAVFPTRWRERICHLAAFFPFCFLGSRAD